jgi:hypothetical protein
MNSFETEYSFLAPTWKLPSIKTSSMYPEISSSVPKLAPDAVGNKKKYIKKFCYSLLHSYKK